MRVLNKNTYDQRSIHEQLERRVERADPVPEQGNGFGNVEPDQGTLKKRLAEDAAEKDVSTCGQTESGDRNRPAAGMGPEPRQGDQGKPEDSPSAGGVDNSGDAQDRAPVQAVGQSAHEHERSRLAREIAVEKEPGGGVGVHLRHRGEPKMELGNDQSAVHPHSNRQPDEQGAQSSLLRSDEGR